MPICLQVSLLFANLTVEDILLKDLLDTAAREHSDRFKVRCQCRAAQIWPVICDEQVMRWWQAKKICAELLKAWGRTLAVMGTATCAAATTAAYTMMGWYHKAAAVCLRKAAVASLLL